MSVANIFFLHARKSTDVEDKQVMSIDAQVNELRAFAVREGLNVVSEIIEKQSAKSPGRPIFDAMLDRIEAGEANGILAWHPDRLARNSVDGGRVIHLLDTGKIATLKFPTFWFESTPQGKFMLSMAFSQSKYYVDSLSENTKRGLREKVRRGEYPGPAPIGYLNDYRTKKIIVDRERAPFIKRAFERYAEGTETLDSLRAFLGENGIRTQDGKLLGRKCLSYVLSNPIYYGHFRYVGEVHEGKHEPIISKRLFDEAQDVFKKRWKWSPKLKPIQEKPFLGLLRCAGCGMMITAEHKEKRQRNGNVHSYTYYRCTKKGKASPCPQPYIREEALDAEVSKLLEPFALRSDWAGQMLTLLKDEQKNASRTAVQVAAQKRNEIEKINLRLQKLLDSFLDGVIIREMFATEQAKLMSLRKTLEEQKDACSAGRADWLEPFQNWIITARNAGEIALNGSPQEKKALAQKVFGSNLVLDCKKARGSCVKPWSLLVENSSSGGMVRITGLEYGFI